MDTFGRGVAFRCVALEGSVASDRRDFECRMSAVWLCPVERVVTIEQLVAEDEADPGDVSTWLEGIARRGRRSRSPLHRVAADWKAAADRPPGTGPCENLTRWPAVHDIRMLATASSSSPLPALAEAASAAPRPRGNRSEREQYRSVGRRDLSLNCEPIPREPILPEPGGNRSSHVAWRAMWPTRWRSSSGRVRAWP